MEKPLRELRIIQKYFWVLIIFFVDYSYNITVTYDSSHYFALASIIRGNLPWSEWDPFRGIIFPFLLNSIISIFGENNNALITLYAILHCILFYCLCYLIFEKFNITSLFENIIVEFIIFGIIVIDPIVFGYYHVILTEGVAATLLTLSVVLAYKFYRKLSNDFLNTNKLHYLLFFYFFVPFGWHLKQPYILIVLLPLILTIFLGIQEKKFLLVKYLSKHILIITFISIISILSWNFFLQNTREKNFTRTTQTEISQVMNDNIKLLKNSPVLFGKDLVKKYFALSNIFYFDQQNNNIDRKVSFIRGSENEIIGYRLYTYGFFNYFPLPDKLKIFVKNYIGNYYPPVWLNNIFIFRTISSNFLFSFFYLLLPFIFACIFILIFLRKGDFTLEFIALGTIMGNALLYSLTNLPIDRYLFPGYPLLLLIILIFFGKIFNKVYSNLRLVIKKL